MPRKRSTKIFIQLNIPRLPKSLVKLFRWGFSIAVLLVAIFAGAEKMTAPLPVEEGKPAVLYANRCKDDLRRLFIQAIESADRSVMLIIYSLTDKKIINALNERAQAGVAVQVFHDTSTPQEGFLSLSPQIHVSPLNPSGLMHQKILIVDEEKLWIGSANFTTASLCFYHNLVIGLNSPLLAKAILQGEGHLSLISGGQPIEYWSFPEEGREGLNKLKELLENAKQSIRIGMYTWTHPELTEAIIKARQRGVSVEIALDQGQGYGVGAKMFKKLLTEGVVVRTNGDKRLLHHKFAWIDGTILVNGSANWTQAAFKRNKDCLLILHDLSEEQQKKMEAIWNGLFSITQDADKKLLAFEQIYYEPLDLAA